MGCDIHMYVEYTKSDLTPEQRKKYGWGSWGGRINPGRDYELFGLLADIRGGSAIFPPRGLPDGLGFYSRWDSHMLISENTVEPNFCTLKQAQEYAKWGAKIHNDVHGKPMFVDNPDWHSHSWLNTIEFEHVLNARKLGEYGPADIDYYALLSAMKTLEENGSRESRVVFWFDN